MYRRLSVRLLCFLLAFALPAAAQYTRDNAANKKIDEAVNEHYLATNFDKAEGVLTGTIAACADKCSPGVIAKAWMYVGIVRGSGKNDQAGAKEAFQKAIAADPGVKLDTGIATPDTQKSFEAAGGTAMGAPEPSAEPAASPAEPAAPAAPADEGVGAGSMKCTPDVREVQTRRPIPFDCTTDEEAAGVELKYKPNGSSTWKTVKMNKVGDSYRGELSCDDNKVAGPLEVYVRAKDGSGETVDSWGSKDKPITFTISESTQAEPPAYPGEAAPARCQDASECPPDFPGCGDTNKRGNVDWGGQCENSSQCKSGLLCSGGVCETAPSCDTDSDCETGKCSEGKCDVGDDGGSSGPYKKNWFGLHFGADIAVIGGTDVCNSGEFTCYEAGSSDAIFPTGSAQPGTSIAKGTALGTLRVLVSYDRAFTPNITAGLRLGFAFNGGPPTSDDKKFLPFHGEARLAYWFGRNALGSKGLRPYLFLGGGVAQVDSKVKVTVRDCRNDPTCANTLELDAWRKLGTAFVAAGGGVAFAFKENIAAQLNVNGMYMLGTSGPVIEPSLGLVYGL